MKHLRTLFIAGAIFGLAHISFATPAKEHHIIRWLMPGSCSGGWGIYRELMWNGRITTYVSGC